MRQPFPILRPCTVLAALLLLSACEKKASCDEDLKERVAELEDENRTLRDQLMVAKSASEAPAPAAEPAAPAESPPDAESPKEAESPPQARAIPEVDASLGVRIAPERPRALVERPPRPRRETSPRPDAEGRARMYYAAQAARETAQAAQDAEAAPRAH